MTGVQTCALPISLISAYTREAGVRNLEREIGSVCRKIARKVVAQNDENFKFVVDEAAVKELLGAIKYRPHGMSARSEVGLVNGLAYTEVGGDLLQIEATLLPGTGKVSLTGKLGEVMQESAQAAITYLRSRAAELGIPKDFHKNFDLHIHVPEGAVPKDGPSAGITLATAVASALTGIAVHKNVAMTGEITLRGKVLPIGGLKEKLLAAHRAGITTIIIPKDNEKDLVEIPADILEAFQINPVETMDEVLPIALERLPVPAMPTNELEIPLWQTPTALGIPTESTLTS